MPNITLTRREASVSLRKPRLTRRGRICEVCETPYNATYSDQRTCGRACGWTLRGRGIPEPNGNDLNAPLTAERHWLNDQRKARASEAMLARYHANPDNWTTRRKRRRLFERDAWRCRSCGKQVTDTVSKTDPCRAVAGHIVARATGGEWTDENMATLCHPCNVKDGVNRLPIQTAMVF